MASDTRGGAYYCMNGAGNTFVVVECDSAANVAAMAQDQLVALAELYTAGDNPEGASRQHADSPADQVIVLVSPSDRHQTGEGEGEDRNEGEGAVNDAIPAIWFFNTDGTRAEACGNGTRAVFALLNHPDFLSASRRESPSELPTASPATASHLLALNVIEPSPIGAPENETHVKHHTATLRPDGSYSVAMGTPRFANPRLFRPELPEEMASLIPSLVDYCFVDMGNPHLVLFVATLPPDWQRLGEQIEHQRDIFPNRGNVSFVETADSAGTSEDMETAARTAVTAVTAQDTGQTSPSPITRVHVWERGAGATQACGTAACAIVAAGIKTGRMTDPLPAEHALHFPGGILVVVASNAEDGKANTANVANRAHASSPSHARDLHLDLAGPVVFDTPVSPPARNTAPPARNLHSPRARAL
ncbi:MAG: hypothetical protein K0U36_04240 [Alphaproteobacteria bacterium]|nr:hypothetical protein [Alphaproteobacteria bacterium]